MMTADSGATASDAISVVIPLRDRSGPRLDHCLRSLRWQRPARPVEILLSDFGSSSAHAERIDAAAAHFDARVVRTDTRETWNRARCLNIAIRRCSTPWVLCTDVDMIFAENFVSAVVDALRAGSDRMVVCDCLDLSSGDTDGAIDRRAYTQLRDRATRRPTTGTGACQAASREFFDRVRGYDEAYRFWGYEDADMAWRARSAGLQLVSVSDSTSMLHQWHPKAKEERPLWFWHNRIRYWFTRTRVRKNPRSWGGAP